MLSPRPTENPRDGHQLVFLVGCPRSGTTYLQQLLASHPKIKTGQESYLFNFIAPLRYQWRTQVANLEKAPRGGAGLPCYFEEDQFIKALQDFLFDLLQPMLQPLSGDEIFLEKTPRHALHLDDIHALLPKARLIHLVRDPRDVVASLLAAHRSWGRHWAPGNATAAARLWCEFVNSVKVSAQDIPSDLFYQIRYEDLLADPRQILLDLGKFLDLRWADEILASAIANNTLEIAQKTGGTPIHLFGLAARRRGDTLKNLPGFIRKGKAGNWQHELTYLEKYQVWRVARRLMQAFDYDWPYPW